MKIVLTLFFLGLFLVSCSNDDNVNLNVELTENKIFVSFENEEVVYFVTVYGGATSVTDLDIESSLSSNSIINLVGGDSNSNNILDVNEIWTYRQAYYVTSQDITLLEPLVNEIKVLSSNNIIGNATSIIEKGKGFVGNAILKNQSDIDSFANQDYTAISGNLIIGAFNNEGERLEGTVTNIVDLSRLNTLREAGDLVLYSNINLNSLLGIQNIILKNSAYVEITNNNSLINLEHIAVISRARDLVIENNDDLITLEGIGTVLSLSDILIRNNNSLETLGNTIVLPSGLQNVSIINNDNLNNLDKFFSVETISYFSVEGNNTLLNFQGFNSLRNVINNLSVIGNNNLENFEGLEELYNVGNLFSLSGNSSLISLQGLSSLSQVDSIDIRENNSLLGIDGLASLENANSVVVLDNNALENLNGFVNLNSIESGITALWVTHNIALENLCGLQNLLLNNDPIFGQIAHNLFNPTRNEIRAGNCQL